MVDNRAIPNNSFGNILTIAQLTIRETQRRRILWVGLLMGIAFLAIFGLGFHYVYADVTRFNSPQDESARFAATFMTLAGLYVTNFLIIMVSVLISVATISGEVDTHTIESLLTKPIRRWEVVVGKWLAFAFIILLYVLLLPGGVMLFVYLRARFHFSNIPGGLGLMYLEGLIGLSICMAGGSRLSTLANGALAFMLYGVAFIGGWVEQIGALLRNETAVNLGIIASLVMPSEIMWKKASALFEPQLLGAVDFAGPFAVAAQPSNAMIVYALLYVVAMVFFALWSFSRRDL